MKTALIIIAVGLFAYYLFRVVKKYFTTDCTEIIEDNIYRVGITNYYTPQAALSRAKGYQSRLKIEPEITVINTLDDTKTKITISQLEAKLRKEVKEKKENPWQYFES